MYNTIHPLSVASHAQLNLFTKGRQAEIIRDSLLLVKQAAPLLEKGQNILYINTLTSASAIEQVADKLAARYDREICTFSASSRNVMEKLEFLEHTIISKGIKLLILNSFEFAAVHSRQKHCLTTWLREMRDAHGLRIAVYSMHPQQTLGALGTLAWLADRTEKVGDWKYVEEISSTLKIQENPDVAVMQFSEMLDRETEYQQNDREFVDRPSAFQIKDVSDMLRNYSLKNNDLTPAITHLLMTEHEVINEQELQAV